MKSSKSLSLKFLLAVVLVCFIFPTLYLKVSNLNKERSLGSTYQRRARRTTRDLKLTNNTILYSETKTNCVKPSFEDFPDDFMTQDERRDGGVLVHILIALYVFGALAIACDDYFVASLERICEELKLKNDVAGATFMAAGSSAPEFFTSVIAVFITKGDIGVGTVVGSAVFNILFIVAICGLFAGCVLKLSWWPLIRDCVFYMLTIAALVVVTYDRTVHWYEALLLVVMYLVYVLIMVFNTKLEALFTSCFPEQRGIVNIRDSEESGEENESLIGNDSFKETQNTDDEGDAEKVDVVSFVDDIESPLTMPSGFVKGLLWVLLLLINFLFYITIPDCRKLRWKKWYFVTFVMAVVWIAGLSYLMVWMVEVIGYTLGIPDVIMGLTFLAAGSSVPDGISSLLVARQGEGDMAVSNTVGSNIFDILLCLGVPWLLQTTAVHPNSTVTVVSGSIIYTSASLFGTVVLTLLLLGLNKWRLNKCLGCVFLLLYLAFISVATLFELNIFGDYNLPVCK